MTEERRLAAIMFTDIVGFSAVTERDEAHALRLLDAHRAIVRPILELHSGREIKTMADGFLVEFSSAVDAANCAIDIQTQSVLANTAASPIDEVHARIGIHLGDVVVRDGDILGDGVNIAARIEPLALPDGICVTEDVARQIRRKVSANLESIGRPNLKNISEPIEVFRLSAVNAAAGANDELTPELSIAVLPFLNMSADPENEYFGDGLTEDLLTRLSKISSLKVISRTSVMKYKATTKNMREIGRELNVTTLLEGSVRRSGDRVRVNAQLIDARTDQHLWAETYDRDLSDIFAVQSDLADHIASALEAQITPAEHQEIVRTPTLNMQAYQLYLQGRIYLGQRTAASLNRAVDCFEQAVALDPQYSEAFAGLADCYTWLAIFEFLPAMEAFPRAKAAALKAIELNPKGAEAHASLGIVKFQHDWDWAGAEAELRKAIGLNPNYATAHHFYADFLKGMGRFDDAYREIITAQQLDPLSLAISSGVGHVLYLSRQYDRAIEAYSHTLELDPTFLQAKLWFGRPYMQKGLFKEAVAELKQAVDLSGESTMSLAVLAHAYAASGDTGSATEIVRKLEDRATRQNVPAYWLGLVQVGFGDADAAVAYFERAYTERSAWFAWANVEPRFDPLRQDPRFLDILRRVGFSV